MYKVIGGAKSRTFRVLWMLEELGVPYEHINAHARTDEAKEYNPVGKIPALVVDGTVLLDSVAILQFLADKQGAFTNPAGTMERAQQDSWTHFILDEFDSALWCAARNTFVLPEERRVPAIKDTLKWEFSQSMKTLENRLGDNEFVMGGEMTVPDLLLTHCGQWARVAGFDIPDGALRDYFRRMVKRPAYQKVSAI